MPTGRLDAGTVLPRTRPNNCADTLAIHGPTDPGGAPAGGGLTKRLGASLFKRREWELGETGVLGGTTKNGRLLATHINWPGPGYMAYRTAQIFFLY